MGQTATMTDAVPMVLRPADPAFAADPYPWYAIARESAAVFVQRGDHLRYLTRYADVRAAMRAEPGILSVGRSTIVLTACAGPLAVIARTGTLGW
jgi:hypothetical protein